MAWHEELIDELRVSEQPGGLVRVEPVGSVAAGFHDAWSDLDVRLTVAAGAVGSFFPEVAWLERFGRVYCIDQRVLPDRCQSRIVFEDLRRLDLDIVETEARFESDRWRRACEYVSHDRERERPGDSFWFQSVDAVVKVVRDDLLSAAYVALELSQRCLELALHLRDELHRPMGNEWVAHVFAADASLAEPSAILDHLLATATLFEGLQRMVLPAYLSRRRPLDDLVRQARDDVPTRGAYRPAALQR